MRLRGLAARTVEHRLKVLGLLARHAGKPLLQCTPADLDAWQGSLGYLALESRKSYVSQVRQFYRWAVDAGLLDASPADVLILPQVPRGVPRPISERDLERALAAARPLIRLWCELAAFAGLRASEIAAVERGDLLDEADPPTLIVRGKGSKTRVVPMPPRLLRSLRRYGLPPRGRLFRATGKAVSLACNRHLHRLGMAATLHSLRHRFATQLYQHSGRDIRMVQEMLGHSSPTTTAVYTQVDASRAAPAVAAIDHPLLRPVQDSAS